MAQVGTRLAMIKFVILVVILSGCLGCESRNSSRANVAFGSTGSSELNWRADRSGRLYVISSLFNGKNISKDELKKFSASIIAIDSKERTLKKLENVDCQLNDGTLTLTFPANELTTITDAKYLRILCELTFKEMNIMGGVHGGAFSNKIEWARKQGPE